MPNDFSQHLLATSSKAKSFLLGWDISVFSILAGVNNINNGHPHITVINSNVLVSVLQASSIMVAHDSLSNILLIIRREEPEGFKSKEMKILIALLRSVHAKCVY